MDSDRLNRTLTTTTTTTTNELFICFPSRLSSSSMKLSSSKSILSPGRARDPPTSLSRRLRTNGSIKGGQASPMFPTGGKKRGSAFENPEPSSPKVTCIGQVRVKSKKKGKKMRTLSRRQSGEVSFRKLEQNQNHAIPNNQQQGECLPQRNQKWVHLPLTICEALRTFGSEFSCLFPCRPSCFSSSEREKQEKGEGQSSCGAVLARWLVALQEGERGKERDIELVVGGGCDGEDERRDSSERPVRNSRRHVFDELEINEGMCEVKGEVFGEEEEGRVSVSSSVPPKNALLLMRCRSDPKMATLANRFWESPVVEDEEEEEEHDGVKEVEYEDKDEQVQEQAEEEEGEVVKDDVEMEVNDDEVTENVDLVYVNEEQDRPESESNLYVELQDNKEEEPQEDLQINEELHLGEETESEKAEETEVHHQRVDLEEENVSSDTLYKDCEDEEIKEKGEDNPIQDTEEEHRASSCSSCSVNSDSETEEESLVEKAALDQETEEESLAEKVALVQETEESTMEKVIDEEEEETVTHDRSDPDDEVTAEEDEEEGSEAEERESVGVKNQEERERERTLLPDCLLMMMCEPKLSMEVSKETWVCSTDFIRFQPKKVVKPIDGGDDESNKRVLSIDSDSNPVPTTQSVKPQPHQHPPRSSISLPAAAVTGVSMATMIEQKLVNAVAYEPFVLTRCKSAPMRTASKLAPDTCFWKNRNLEPHRCSNFGVGAAGVGF